MINRANTSARAARASIIVATVALAGLVIVGGTLAVTGHRQARAGHLGLAGLPQPQQSNVALTARDVALLQDVAAANPGFAFGPVDLLTRAGATGFYRITNGNGPACFGIGGHAQGQVLGAVECLPAFPSASTPVLDFTVLHGQPGSADARVWHSAGFAADTIATIAFTTADGSIVSKTPVVNDLFNVTDLPEGPITAIVGLDAAGNTIWSKPIS